MRSTASRGAHLPQLVRKSREEGGAQPGCRSKKEGKSRCQPGGGSTQPSHGAGAADSRRPPSSSCGFSDWVLPLLDGAGSVKKEMLGHLQLWSSLSRSQWRRRSPLTDLPLFPAAAFNATCLRALGLLAIGRLTSMVHCYFLPV